MKTKVLHLIFTAALLVTVFHNASQSQWLYNNPYPTSNMINSVYFINNNTGWLAGDGGMILKTTNGGVNWELTNTNITRNLNCVQFLSQNIGYACGEFNALIKSTNGGNDWFTLRDSTNSRIFSLHFVDSTTGYTAGDDGLMKTKNGGLNWVVSPEVSGWLHDVYFVNPYKGWAVAASGYIYATTNSGSNWIRQYSSISHDIYVCHFINENTGWLSTNTYPATTPPTNRIAKTTNGGVNWEYIVTQNKTGIDDMYFIDANTGYTCGYVLDADSLLATVQKTTDGGYNWSNYYVFNGMIMRSLDYKNGTIWTAGNNIFKSTNGGENWTRETKGFYHSVMTAAIFPPSQNIYLGGVSGFFGKSSNGGANWSESFIENSEYINNLYFLNQNTGWACDYGRIHKTTNGGSNWTTSITPDEQFIKLHFVNENTGWVTSYRPSSAYKTTNGGLNWFNLTGLSAQYAHGLYFLNANTGFVGDIWGYIYKTTDGGTNWTTYNTETYNWVADFEFFDENTGFAAGELHSIWKTTNAGTNWEQILTRWYGSFYDMEFIREGSGFPKVGYAVGSYMALYRTSNGGNNWYPMVSPTNQRMYQVRFINKYTGYIVGSNGTVLYTTNGGSTFVYNSSEKIPDNYMLHQNYPNPFNNSTVISFDVKTNSNLKIIVYDVTGKEMQTLINGHYQAGTYKMTTWFGDYPSGVYFYKMTSDKYSETRRMIIVK